LGIASSILLLSELVTWLLDEEPILIWAFFFGLVVASILYVFKKIERLNAVVLIVLLLGIFIAYQITKLEILNNSESYPYLFLSGAIAICAMILPGISGAFILVIMGAYASLLQAINDRDLLKIATFGLGALFGILSFSRILKWFFTKYKDLTLALLTGFMAGALVKIWPWKKILTERINSKEIPVPLREECVLPYEYEGDPQLFAALTLMLIGFQLIFIFDFISVKTKSLESS
jgi:putative membrane protein